MSIVLDFTKKVKEAFNKKENASAKAIEQARALKEREVQKQKQKEAVVRNMIQSIVSATMAPYCLQTKVRYPNKDELILHTLIPGCLSSNYEAAVVRSQLNRQANLSESTSELAEWLNKLITLFRENEEWLRERNTCIFPVYSSTRTHRFLLDDRVVLSLPVKKKYQIEMHIPVESLTQDTQRVQTFVKALNEVIPLAPRKFKCKIVSAI